MHTPRAHLEAMLAEGRLIHAIRDLRLLTGLGLGEARDALHAAQGGDWPPEVLGALPSWGDTAAERALRDELWPALAEIGPPRALVFAERDFRDGLLVLIAEQLLFARRGLRGPEIEALGALSELKGLSVRESLSGLEVTLKDGAKEHRIRRVAAKHKPFLERLSGRIDASGVSGEPPLETGRSESASTTRAAPKRPSPPPRPTPPPKPAPPPKRAPPKPRDAIPEEAGFFKEGERPEAEDRITPPDPVLDIDRPMKRQGLPALLLRLGMLSAFVVVITQAIWDLPILDEYLPRTFVSWLLTAGVGLNMTRAPGRAKWAVAGVFAVTLAAQVLLVTGVWAAMVFLWPIFGAFWLRAQGRETWLSEAAVLGAVTVFVMASLDRIWLMFGGSPFVFHFADLIIFWGLHLLWERSRTA